MQLSASFDRQTPKSLVNDDQAVNLNPIVLVLIDKQLIIDLSTGRFGGGGVNLKLGF